MPTNFHPLHTTKETASALQKAAKAFGAPSVQSGREGRGKAGPLSVGTEGVYRFVLVGDWKRQIINDEEIENTAYRAKARIVYSDMEKYAQQDKPNDQEYTIYNTDINLNKPNSGEGDQVTACLHKGRWELLNFETDETVRAKELFPAVHYRQYRLDGNGNRIYDEDNQPIIDEYIICPGGRGANGATKIIHVLDLHTRKWSTSMFGTLPVSMANFGACIVENEFDEPELVCSSGQTEETDQNPVQFYNFEQEVWRKTNDKQSFAGCPIFSDGKGKAIIIGGQSAYYIGEKREIFSGSGGLTQYGWTATPLWTIDVTAGTVGPKYPARQVNYSLVPVEREMAFMKTNFDAAEYKNRDGQKSVSYVAFGGTETVSAHNNAVVSYNDDAFVDTNSYTDRPSDRVELFPDSPVPLGECAVVGVNRISNGNGGMKPCNRVLCIGGRMRKQVEVEVELPNGGTATETKTIFVPHEKVWSLEMSDKNWIDDLFGEIPIPRWNAPTVGVTLKRTVCSDCRFVFPFPSNGPDYCPSCGDQDEDTDDPNKPNTEIIDHDLIFLVGGRNEEGLLADVDVLNLTTMEWETDWPDFNNKVRKKEE